MGKIPASTNGQNIIRTNVVQDREGRFLQECGAWAINQTLLRLFFSFLRIPPNISPDLAVLLGAPRSHCGPVGGEEKYRNTGRLKIQKYACHMPHCAQTMAQAEMGGAQKRARQPFSVRPLMCSSFVNRTRCGTKGICNVLMTIQAT